MIPVGSFIVTLTNFFNDGFDSFVLLIFCGLFPV